MKVWLLLLTMLLGPCPSLCGAGVKGDVYLLGVALDQAGAPGGWVRVGPAGAWKDTLAGAVLGGRLYTVETSGGLFATHLDTGEWKQIGKPEFGNTRLMFAAGDRLYTVEKNGSLYRIDPADGSWAQVGAEGAWGGATAGAVLHGQLFSVEKDGGLYAGDLSTGGRKRIGKIEFAMVRWMVAAGNQLCTIEADGDLNRVNPFDGSRERVGPAGAWKQTHCVSVLDGQLYSTETGGGLRRTDLRAGRRDEVGKSDFAATACMFASAGLLYTIETDGNLYRVTAKPNMDDFDWCPREIEKVFREQGNSFYRALDARQVLGAQATHAGIMSGFTWLREKATRNDLVVIYVGAHGSTDPKQGWGISTADDRMLWGHEIKAELARLPCQALVMVETCTSGGFAQRHPDDPPLPANVTALCACRATQTTNNQLDLAVAEALYGRADFNRDGVVDVEELNRYIELRYAEWWPNPKPTDDSETPVIVQSKALPGSMPLTEVSASLSAVAVGNDLWSALLERQAGGQCQVHLLGWSDKPGEPYFVTNSVPRDAICLPGDGPPLLVEHEGQWLPARLLSESGGKYAIHYLGRNQDDMVAASRIKYPFAGRPK